MRLQFATSHRPIEMTHLKRNTSLLVRLALIAIVRVELHRTAHGESLKEVHVAKSLHIQTAMPREHRQHH